jgi:hypothetical protein
MSTLSLVLLIVAAVCFAIAAFWQPQPSRVNLVAAGLLSWVLAELLPSVIKS